jgi:hypothetical protein
LVVTTVLAALVVVGALVGATLLRPRPGASAGAAVTTTAPAIPAATPKCGQVTCQSLATAAAGDSTVSLLAAVDPATHGQRGLVRFEGKVGTILFETNISQADATLTRSSLACVSGSVPTCVVFGEYSGDDDTSGTQGKGGALGEVFVERGGYWARAGDDFLYASAGYFALQESTTGGDPTVVTVQNDCTNSKDGGSGKDTQCAKPKVYVEVFSLANQSLGCSRSVSSVGLLPGAGTRAPTKANLRSCQDG